MNDDNTFEYEYCPRGEVERLTQKLAAAQKIINEQGAEIQRLRGEVEDLQQPAALGWDASVRKGLQTPEQIARSDRATQRVRECGRKWSREKTR